MFRQQIDSGLELYVGDAYESNSTILINGDDVLLVECLGSVKDAKQLKVYIEEVLKKNVRFIICTHYFSDHLAGLKCFPNAQIIAHRNYIHTFTTERFRTEEEAGFFVEPTILINDRLEMKWGRYRLEIFHNPSQTLGTLCVDVPEADLMIIGDSIVQNIVYLSYSAPELFFAALSRLQRRRRNLLIASHGGVRKGDAIDLALQYLVQLRANVLRLRKEVNAEELILGIPLESCRVGNNPCSDIEQEYHQRNLASIVERDLFTVAA